MFWFPNNAFKEVFDALNFTLKQTFANLKAHI